MRHVYKVNLSTRGFVTLSRKGGIMKNKIKTRILTLLLTITMVMVFPYVAEAKTTTYYDDYGIAGGVVCYSTRVKYTYDTADKTVKNSKGKTSTVISKVENKSKGNATRSTTVSNTKSTSYTISGKVPQTVYQKILNCNLELSVGVTKTESQTISATVSADLPAKSYSEVYLRYDTKTTVYNVVCQKQKQNISGKWVNVGKPYTKKLTKIEKVPVVTLGKTKKL